MYQSFCFTRSCVVYEEKKMERNDTKEDRSRQPDWEDEMREDWGLRGKMEQVVWW